MSSCRSRFIDVQNTGKVKGTEIPQLYLGSPAPDSPSKVLRGFDKADLSPGETKTICFSLTRRDLSLWDVTQGGWVLPEGSFQAYLGTSSRKIAKTASFQLDLQ